MSKAGEEVPTSTLSTISPIIPGRTHARKVFRELSTRTNEHNLAFYLVGEQVKYRNDTDRELAFRQESNFVYVSGGCDVPGSSLLAYCVANETDRLQDEAGNDFTVHTILFIPEVDELDVMWSGMPLTTEELKKQLDVSDVRYVTEMEKTFAELPTTTIHLLPSCPLPSQIDSGKFSTDDKHLLLSCQIARLIKTPSEIDLIQKANNISSRAHEGVMKAYGGGDLKSEYEASAVFSYYCARAGAKSMAYEVIAASGTSAGTLHYIKNKASFPETGDTPSLLLLDAGCEHENYAADITRTFPVGNGGKFTKEAKEIYQIVEDMQDEAFGRIRPGAEWEEIHIIMHSVAARHLLKLGILRKPDSALISRIPALHTGQDDARGGREYKQLTADIVDSGITTAFFPHGLGHHLGLDVHDSAQAALPNGKSTHPLAKYLRYRGPLAAGMVVTVEPGIYFNPFLLKPFADSPFLDKEVLERYMPVGGVRIEDDVLVTPHGFHNMTTVPRSIEKIEALCASRAIPAPLAQ